MKCTASGQEPSNPTDAPTPTDATRPDGQKADHWVLCPGEIIRTGFVRPIRKSYQHVGPPGPEFPLLDLTEDQKARHGGESGYVKFERFPPERAPSLGRYWSQAQIDKIDKGCGTVTTMPTSIAETYAAQPGFYGSTFCCGCRIYLPVGPRGEFIWDGTKDRVGT